MNRHQSIAAAAAVAFDGGRNVITVAMDGGKNATADVTLMEEDLPPSLSWMNLNKFFTFQTTWSKWKTRQTPLASTVRPKEQK